MELDFIDILKEKVEKTIDGGLKYNGTIDEIDYYKLSCTSAAKDKLYSFSDFNFCIFNCIYEDVNAFMVLLSVPINSEKNNKHISERLIEIVESIEESFITVDYLDTIEVKQEKFVYVIAVKKIE